MVLGEGETDETHCVHFVIPGPPMTGRDVNIVGAVATLVVAMAWEI